MYRDFIYLDTGRVQSIIAQLNEGTLEKVIEGRTSDLEGKAGLAAGILTSLLPVELGGTASKTHSVQSSKVLHDYAFNVALESLKQNDLCLEVQDWDRDSVPIPDGAFITVRGSMSILDYSLLKNLAENEATLNRLFGAKGSNPQQSGKKHRDSGVIKQIWAFVEALMGDSLQVRLKRSEGLVFSGTLSREYLRERTRDLIFKYGGQPQTGWTMLAQVSQVTIPDNKLDALNERVRTLPGTKPDEVGFSSVSDVVNTIVEVLNAFQEAMASVSYPAIAVTPVAVFRELKPFR